MSYFFEYEIEKSIKETLQNFFNSAIKDFLIKTEYEIQYQEELQIKLLKKNDTISKVHFEAYFENGNYFKGHIFINIIDYSPVDLFHIRFIYKDEGNNSACLYHIFDLFDPKLEYPRFQISGEEANVSQYEFIHYDKPIGKLFNNSELLNILKRTSVEIIRTYFTDKQRNKT